MSSMTSRCVIVAPAGAGAVVPLSARYRATRSLSAWVSVIVAPDDVVAAFLREAGSSHPDPQQYLLDAGRELARTLSSDVRRLNNVLKRLSP